MTNKWAAKAESISKLVKEKNEAYGSSFDNSGKILRVLYPNGMAPHQYDDALTFTRMIDKMFRIANQPDAFGESPWDDLVGYSLLGAVRAQELRTQEPRAQGPSNEYTGVVEVLRDGMLIKEPAIPLGRPGFNEQQIAMYQAQGAKSNNK